MLYSMGVTSCENVELASYQLKDVAQTWYVQWRDNRVRGGLVIWKIYNATFLDRFFPREMRDEKVMEFINLIRGGKSVHVYSLEFIKLSKYDPSLASDPRHEMSHFVTGMSEDLQDECQSSMLHDNINISHLTVYT